MARQTTGNYKTSQRMIPMLKKWLAISAVAVVTSGLANAQTPKPDPIRQAKQDACRAEAKAKNITKGKQNAFMKECKARP